MLSYKQHLLSELDNARWQVDDVLEQAIVLTNAHGGLGRELIEHKLAELNRNFEKVSQHIESANVSNYIFI